MTLKLTSYDQALLQGEHGAGSARAMNILVSFTEVVGATSLLDIVGAHVDGCLYHGQVCLDFVDMLLAGGSRVQVPTTLNVGSLDLIHPDLVLLQGHERLAARRLMKAHEDLGCVPSFTCAPYQGLLRPTFGQQVAWGESNAIVFANSVIGARTNRYGDFLDLCCAITGRAPAWGLHLDANRRGKVLFRLTGFPASLEASDSLYVAVGLLVGAASGERIPVIEGLPQPRDEDQLKAFGAASASAGAVGMFHITGVTPEAATLQDAFGGVLPEEVIALTPADISEALNRLSTVPDGSIVTAICLGTPHFSLSEWKLLLARLRRSSGLGAIPIYVNTSRATLATLRMESQLDGLEGVNLIPVADTCTYVTAILRRLDGVVMTNSGKWAHYAPGNLGCDVAFGSLEACIASAETGRVTRVTL